MLCEFLSRWLRYENCYFLILKRRAIFQHVQNLLLTRIFNVFIARRSLKLSVNSELTKRYNNLGNKNKVSILIHDTNALVCETGSPVWAGNAGEQWSCAKRKYR